MTGQQKAAALEISLRRRFRVVETGVKVAGRVITVLHPQSAEDLIDEREFEQDERLPYWAELWPSSRVLAERVLSMEGAGRTLLELGCGTGLVTSCAALAGFEVTASDYYEDAVRFARVNAVRNGAAEPRGLLLDWRKLPPRPPKFDVVVASDVLYERPYGALVAATIGAMLADGGCAVVADPGRVARDEFLRALPGHDLEAVGRTDVVFREEKIRQTIALFVIGRNTAARSNQ